MIVAGDGDFLSIGAEHIGPAAQRNLDVTCIIMDNGVYGLTKGQSSPTTQFGVVTSTTPGGKIEERSSPSSTTCRLARRSSPPPSPASRERWRR